MSGSRLVSAALAGALTLLLLPLPLAAADVQRAPIGVVDLHVDLSYETNYKGHSFDHGVGQYVASEIQAGGVAGVVLPLYIPRNVSPTGPRMRDLESSYQSVFDLLTRTPPYALPGCRPAKGRVRTWLSFENANPLAADPSAVTRWVARGVRLFGLVHSYDNDLATSSGSGHHEKRGLTAKGRNVAERVIAAGGVLDVSHASDAATRDMIDLSLARGVPVVASHSDARALADNPRNLTDAQIRDIGKSGGVIGVNFHSPFLAVGRRATLHDVVRHVQHLVKVAGIEHVAIGSDFEGGIRPPRALGSAAHFQALASALLKAGFDRGEVSKVFHENALRVLCHEPDGP